MPDPGPGAGPSAGADGVLRAALELAFDVARIGARSSPPIEAPRAIRPFLHFTGRLPDGALAAMRRGLDEDESFRERVAALAEEVELGRAGWLVLVRPDGWEEELARILEDADARARAELDEREERSARRKLLHAEQARERAEAAAARARAESAAASTELAAERRSRRGAQEEAAQLSRRVGSLEGERDSARRRAAESAAEVARLTAELDVAERELARLGRTLEAAEAVAEAQALQARAAQLRAEAGGRGPAPAPPGPATAGPGGAVDGPDLQAVADAVSAAAEAASALGAALGAASSALASTPVSERPPPPAGGRPATGAGPSRRRPATLPPAVFDDTTAAAAHLVRVPGALVLVDGYNAAKALWPEVSPLELRERLGDALSELVARTGAAVHVVYDGADVGLPASRPAGSRGVRVTFSPADVEADDVILDLVDAEPAARTVVVASSDNRVRDGARRRGANVISSAQLAAVLGRS